MQCQYALSHNAPDPAHSTPIYTFVSRPCILQRLGLMMVVICRPCAPERAAILLTKLLPDAFMGMPSETKVQSEPNFKEQGDLLQTY